MASVISDLLSPSPAEGQLVVQAPVRVAPGVLPCGRVFEFARKLIRLCGGIARVCQVRESSFRLARPPGRSGQAARQLGRSQPDLEVHRIVRGAPPASPPEDPQPVHGTDGLNCRDLLRCEDCPGYADGDLALPTGLGRLGGEDYGPADVVPMRVPLRVDIDREPVSM